MWRYPLGWACVIVSFTLTGCTMCCHLNDYCGPVYENGCTDCSSHHRAGSILEGGQHRELVPRPMPQLQPQRAVPTPARPKPTANATASRAVYRQQATPVSHRASATAAKPRVPTKANRLDLAEERAMVGPQGEGKTGDVPGSERIVSVTERIVGDTERGGDLAPEITHGEAANDGVAAVQKLPASGWTARKSDSDLLR